MWAALLLYGTSWALYWNAGIFLDGQAFRFWAPNPVQVFHWVYPPLAVAVIVSSVAAAAVLVLVARLALGASVTFKRRLVVAAGGLAVASIVFAVVGALVYGADPRVATAPKPPFAVARDDRTSPLTHVLAGNQAFEPPPAATDVAANGARVLRRPIISLPQYLATIDRSRLKRWNVVMVQLESLRADQLRAYGGTRNVLPTLDALARESRVFTNAYIQASHSNYADLVPLSSQYPLRSPNIYGYPVNPPYPHVLIYDVLKWLGYRTAIVSSQNENWGGMSNFHNVANLDRFFHAATFRVRPTRRSTTSVFRAGCRTPAKPAASTTSTPWRRRCAGSTASKTSPSSST